MKLLTTTFILLLSFTVTSCSDSKYEGADKNARRLSFDEAVKNSIQKSKTEPRVLLSTSILKNVVIGDIEIGDRIQIVGKAHRIKAQFKTNVYPKSRKAVEEYRCNQGDTCYEEVSVTCQISTRERLEDLHEFVDLMQEDVIILKTASKDISLKNLIVYGDFKQDETGDFSLLFTVSDFMLNDFGVIKLEVENSVQNNAILIGQTQEECPGVYGNGNLGRYQNYKPQSQFIHYDEGISIKAEIRKL